MKIVAPLLGVLMLAGCANPYAIPPPTRLVLRPATPRYLPPPVVFRPNTPAPNPGDIVIAPKLADPEPAAVVDPAPVATVEPPAPAPIAIPAAVQKPKLPESGSAVPLMGFRPMKGQKAPGA